MVFPLAAEAVQSERPTYLLQAQPTFYRALCGPLAGGAVAQICEICEFAYLGLQKANTQIRTIRKIAGPYCGGARLAQCPVFTGAYYARTAHKYARLRSCCKRGQY